MRRRNSTKSGSTLTRSKSSASIRCAVQRLEHIDPVIAERDAHIAASLSFSRAGLASDPEIRPWLSHDHNRSGHMESWPEDPTSDDRSQHDFEENGIRRQQSVRFVRQGFRSRHAQSQANDTSSDTDTIRRRNILKDVENRPQTQAPGKFGRPFVSTYTTNYVDSLPPVDSFRPPDECAPPPASYQNLRKSRSMFTPSNRTPAIKYYLNDSSKQMDRQPSLQQPQSMQDMKENKSPTKPMELRAPKSTSFLKLRGTVGVARTSSRLQNDLAVQDAEETFRRNIEDHQRLKPRSSIFFPRTKKSQTTLGLRKSMREFGSDAYLTGTTTPLTVSKDASLRKRARKVSNSLKAKLKEIFGRSKKEKPATVANENGAVNIVGNDGMESEQDDPYMDIIDPVPTDECSISQVPSRVPSLHNACSSRRLRSRQGSIESIGSERKVSNEKSRVTSWTSSGTHTLDSQSTWGGERDRQRLSIIKENGPHYSSSSFRRQGIIGHNRYELPPSPPSPVGDPALSETSMDKVRVCSALIDRFRDTKQDQQKKEGLRHSSSWDWNLGRHGSTQLPEPYNEQGIKEVGKQKPSTIRCVLQDDDVFQDSWWEQKSQKASGIEVTKSVQNESTSSSGSAVHHRQRSESDTTLASQKSHSKPVVFDGHGSPLSRSSTAHSKDVTLAPKTLSTRSSAFFGSPTCQLFRTKSPYRKALQASIKENNQASTELRSSTAPSLDLELIPIRRRPSLSEEDPRLAYSESIYSDELRSPRTTPRLNSKPAGPIIPPRHPSHRAAPVGLEKASFAGIYLDAAAEHSSDSRALVTARCDTPGARGIQLEPLTYIPTTPINRTASDGSSVEWKTWLSANASKADANLANARAQTLTEVRYAKPSMPRTFGHVREGAEIEDSRSPISYKPTCSTTTRLQTPLRTMSHNSRQASSASRVELGTKTPVSMTPSRDENAAPRSDGRVSKHRRGVYGPPAIPPRSSLRTTPSMPLMRPRSSRTNVPIKFADIEASKMPSFDTMPKLRSAKASPGPQIRSPVTTFRRNGVDNGIRSSSSSPGLTKAFKKQFGPSHAKENPNDRKGVSPRRKEGSMLHHLWDSSDYGIADRADKTSYQDRKPQMGGGRQMVEDFLSSRRQISIMGNEPTAFI